MKKKIILPSLFVLSSFLVGLMPKTSKAGSITSSPNPKIDSVSYNMNFDSCSWSQKQNANFVDYVDSLSQQQDNKDSVSYTISWYGGSWVKYTSNDGSGFIRTGGSRTWRNMNPGALRHGDFSKQYGACGSAGGFAVFPTEEHGMKALCALLQSDKYANLTIAAAIYKYAPPSDNNNPKSYQQKLSNMTGLSLNRKLYQLTPAEIERVAFAIKEIEGWKSGKNEVFEAEHAMISRVLDKSKFLAYKNLGQRQYNG